MSAREYRVTITSVQDVYEYVVEAGTKTEAEVEGRRLAREDGWNCFGTTEATRL